MNKRKSFRCRETSDKRHIVLSNNYILKIRLKPIKKTYRATEETCKAVLFYRQHGGVFYRVVTS